MSQAAKECDGLPEKLRPPNFHACESCITSKMSSHKRDYQQKQPKDIQPGSYFQLDYAFIRGPSENENVGIYVFAGMDLTHTS